MCLDTSGHDNERYVDENSQAPPTVVRVCVVEEITNHLEPLFFEESHASDIRANDQAGHGEHGPAIFTRPVTSICLNLFVKRVSVAGSVERALRLRECRETLRTR
jgi:hypothetical protein